MIGRRHSDHDDPERIPLRSQRPTPEDQVRGLGLFDTPAPLRSWPERPEVHLAEQRGLGLPESDEARYREWRKDPFSDEVLRVLKTVALEQVAAGATYVRSRWSWEEARKRLKRSVDNRLQALACREIEDTTPMLKGMFRHRERKAS